MIRLEITESAHELKVLMNQQTKAVARSKLQILWWLATEQVSTVKELVERCGYHRTTISRWLSQYRNGGMDALLEAKPRTGRHRAISAEVLAQLETELQRQEGLCSYSEVQQWLLTKHGLDLPYKTVHKTVYYYLKAKVKVLRPTPPKTALGA